MHGQLQHPAARLAGRTPRSSVVPLEPFKNKVFKLRRQGPGKRSLPGRPTKALQGTCHDAPRALARQQGPGKRSLPGRPTKASRGPVSDKLPDPTRQRPRQGACRGKLPLCTRAPAHPPTCHPGAFPGARGERLCSQRCAVASGANKIAIVASGGVPYGPFLHYLGGADGHLMPLSPAVRVRYDTLYR